MKPTLTALAASAALACLAVPAQAQSTSSVVLSGLVDAYAGSMRNAGDPGHTAVVGSGGLTTSWFGFKGIEDLGGGLKATFAVTSFFRPDTGSQGRFNGDPIFSRDANVGLAGGFGTVQLGRGLAPNFLPTILANPFGDSFTFSPLVLHANVGTTGWPRTTTPSDTGWSNQVIYSTPKFGGFGANLHYQFGEQSSSTGNDSKKNVGINGTYFGGPVTLVAFYERDQISNPVNPGLLTTTVGGVALPETRKNWMVGGAYDFTLVKAYATYGRSKAEISSLESKTGSLGVSVPLGAGSVLAAVARTEATSNAFNADRTTASIGYDYFLSKRTDVYAIAMRDRVTALSSGNSFGVGVRHRF
jgi:predicted porin